jgi:glutamyl-tRNA reductase
MKFFFAGLSYKTAPVEVREKLALSPEGLRCHGCRLKLSGNLSELVLVSTCNRVELYGVAPKESRNLERLFRLFSREDFDFAPYLYVKEGDEAIQHLLSVASGLDSLVIGETEIIGQVKTAYLAAQQAGLTGRITNRLFQTALQTAKEVRTQTGIGRGATSVGSVAVELAERIFDQNFSTKTILIIGAGKMGEACVRHLAKKGARSVLVVNRSYERAVSLAGEFGGRAVRFEDLFDAMSQADIVVSSTGAPQTIVHKNDLAQVMSARRDRPLFLVDIAVPRDIDADVESVDGVFLYNVDHLETIVLENVKNRQAELGRCRRIIGERATALVSRLFGAPEKQAARREGQFKPVSVTLPQPAWSA